MKRRIWAAILAGGIVIMTAACAERETEESQTLLVQEDVEEAYPTTTVEYGDITKYASISCEYIATEREYLAFSMDGYLIDRVDVKMGDYVTKGQLLVSLDVQYLEKMIEEQEYLISSLELELQHTEEMKEFDLASAETLYTYTSMQQQDKENLKKKKDSIIQQYQTTLENMEDNLSIQRMRLQQYREEFQEGRLFAGITGEVTYLQNDLVDTYTVKDRDVVAISNLDTCYFTAGDAAYADYFEEGVSVNVFYRDHGTGYDCEVVPVLMDQWDTEMYFKPVGDEIIATGTDGKITIELDRREHVLCVPEDAVHESDKGPFVYLAKDGLLEMRYVTVGLEGDDLVEIKDGLKQGETVALKK